MKIPIFLSCPSVWNPEQGKARTRILAELERAGMEWRSLGKTDYPTMYPLREVHAIAKHCSGGIVLGFTQFECKGGTWKPGSKGATGVKSRVVFPTPWNQLEAGILFSLGLPMLVFSEEGIRGGVFDPGVTDVFVHPMPMKKLTNPQTQGLREVILKWSADVRTRYYQDDRTAASS